MVGARSLYTQLISTGVPQSLLSQTRQRNEHTLKDNAGEFTFAVPTVNSTRIVP